MLFLGTKVSGVAPALRLRVEVECGLSSSPSNSLFFSLWRAGELREMVFTLDEGRMLSLYCSVVGLALVATGVTESLLFCCLEAS